MSKDSLSTEQLEILDGAMLGDGSLIVHKHGKNAYFSYNSKSNQHVEYVIGYFKDFITDAGIRYYSIFDKRTCKTYDMYCARTHAMPDFTDQYNRWYEKGKKDVPEDVILTSKMCLIWYIGDGCICTTSHKHSSTLKISTHDLSYESQTNILVPQLKYFDANVKKVGVSKTGENQYSIFIPHYKIQDFLDFIGECPFSDYLYKWSFTKYKNFCIHREKNFNEDIVRYFNGGASAGTIAKYFKIDRSTVVKYLKLNGIDPSKNAFAKIKIDEIIKNEGKEL